MTSQAPILSYLGGLYWCITGVRRQANLLNSKVLHDAVGQRPRGGMLGFSHHATGLTHPLCTPRGHHTPEAGKLDWHSLGPATLDGTGTGPGHKCRARCSPQVGTGVRGCTARRKRYAGIATWHHTHCRGT